MLTKITRNETIWAKGPAWFYIYTHLKEWSRQGIYFDLPVISEEEISVRALNRMKIEDSWHYATVKNVTLMDKRTAYLHIKITRRIIEKKVDYRYGGIINYLDSERNL